MTTGGPVSAVGGVRRRPLDETLVLVRGLMFIALVVAAIGSLGAPLITAVAESYRVSLDIAQWTLTIPLLVGAVATPLLGRLGSADRRRETVLVTLAIVVAGSVATLLPGGIAVLLVGRAAQGAGLALTALMMATAREHLAERSAGAIAMLSVASTAGIGVGYPLAGLLAQVDGVRAAYGLGLAVTVSAFLVALRVLPRSAQNAPGTSGQAASSGMSRVDVRGAVLLSAALVAVLLLTSTTSWWSTHTILAAALLVFAVVLFGVWARVERRTPHPLVDLAALRHPSVAGANLVMAVAGVGMYLLLTLVSRFVQTPARVGYGFGLTFFQAGLMLVPFAALGFASGRVVPWLSARRSPFMVLAGSGAAVVAAFAVFALGRDHITAAVVAMALLGAGVGAFSAAMPQAILAVTPPAETAAAMSVNQVVRGVGFSVGSAVGGLTLAAATPATTVFPRPAGYTLAAWIGAGILVASILLALIIDTVHVSRTATDGFGT